MKIAVPLLASFLLAASVPLAAHADTVLHLSEIGQVTVHPDRLVAALRVEASSASPADAQKKVNVAMAQALTDAHDVPRLTISTSAYSSWQTPAVRGASGPEAKAEWHAGQTLLLESGDASALLGLVGKLQAGGLVLARLEWQVAPEAAGKARAEAQEKALQALRVRAEAAAGSLGLKFESFRSVSLDAAPGPRPMPMMARAAAAPAPAAEPAETTVHVVVSGEALLTGGTAAPMVAPPPAAGSTPAPAPAPAAPAQP